MPGEHVEEIPHMANTICQNVWNRDFDKDPPNNDRLTTFGGWLNHRSFLLIDHGPVDEQYTLVKLRWDGEKLFVFDCPCALLLLNSLKGG